MNIYDGMLLRTLSEAKYSEKKTNFRINNREIYKSSAIEVDI